MGRKKTFTDRQLEVLIDRYAGCYSLIADALGVTRQSVWERVMHSEALQLRVFHAAEALTDTALFAHIQRVRNGDRAAEERQIFHTASGRRRGYGVNADVDVLNELEGLKEEMRIIEGRNGDTTSHRY